jgi:protein dithiol oxidoreductase (disulfide-forming)
MKSSGRRIALGLGALGLSAFLLTACGKQGAAPGSEPSTPASAPAAPAATAPASAPAGASPTDTAPSADKTAPAARSARINEDGSETIEENTGDTGAHNPLLAAVATSAAAATTEPASVWKEGVNYNRLVPAQPTAAGPDQVEVLEVFWYGCSHCYALDPLVEAWRKHKAGYIRFSRVPVMWDNDVHRAHARLFYTMDDLGKLEQLHTLTFKEIHVNGDMLAAQDPSDSEKMQMAFLGKFGVTPEEFRKSYRSFNVETNLQRAEQTTLRYGVTGVPTFVINGKYVTDVGMAGGQDKILTLVDSLAAQEHKH